MHEYAQDKLEQLLALPYADATSDTRTFPAVGTGGSGLAVGGSYDVNNPVALAARDGLRGEPCVR